MTEQQYEELGRLQGTLRDAVAKAVELVKEAGAEAQVSVSKVHGLSISSRLGEVENIEFNNDGGLSIAVYDEGRKGNATTSKLDLVSIKQTVDAALSIARYTSSDPCAGLADKELLEFNPPELELYHPQMLETEDMINRVIEVEKSALNYDKKIVNSNGAAFNSFAGISVYGNSDGILNSFLSSRYSMSCSVIGEMDGLLESDSEYTVSRDFSKLMPTQWVGINAAKKTVKRLAPRKLATLNAPVLFLSDVATGLIGSLVGAMSGHSVYQKSTFLLDKVGEQVLPDWLNIHERPHILGGLASSPYDAEGVKTSDREIIKSGILQSYLLSSYSARKLGLKSTGHAGGIHNWLVDANRVGGLDALLQEMGTGLLVTDLMGQGINLVTGDYSRGAAGFWVEDGEIQYPVSEITISGSLPEMYRNIIAIGDDIEHRSNIQTGSILLQSMKISGS